jgi:hypothetical protein
MSETVNNWNTKEIRAFKEAFGHHKDEQAKRGWFDHLDKAEASEPHYRQAQNLLNKRREHATVTFKATVTGGAVAPEAIKQLSETERELNARTDKFIDDAPSLTGMYQKILPETRNLDPDTDKMIAMAQEWITFEAHCISVSNEITVGKDDKGVQENLKKRAKDQLDLAGELSNGNGLDKKSEVFGNLGKLQQTLIDLNADASTGPVNTETFRRALEDATAKLAELAKKVAATAIEPDKVRQTTIQKTYGLTIEADDNKTVPYDRLIEALSLMPRDHLVEKVLTKIKISTRPDADAQGGSFDLKKKLIDIYVDTDSDTQYYDPETRQVVNANSFATTTLHEIGHSVDEAFRIMAAHGKEPGCGGWTEMDPTVYMTDAWSDFTSKFPTAISRETAEWKALDEDRMKSGFTCFVAGQKTAEKVVEEWSAVWRSAVIKSDPVILEIGASEGQLRELSNGARAYLDDETPDRTADTKLSEFKAEFKATIAKLTTGASAGFTVDELENKFREACSTTHETTTYGDTVFQERKSDDPWTVWYDKIIDEITPRLNTRLDETIKDVKEAALKCLSACEVRADLHNYVASSAPWKKDLSSVKIGEEPASHQAYGSDAKWWRYTNRNATIVSNYQWRSPGEWFAELYAITWFSKKEPPNGVGKEVRRFLYGGHMT